MKKFFLILLLLGVKSQLILNMEEPERRVSIVGLAMDRNEIGCKTSRENLIFIPCAGAVCCGCSLCGPAAIISAGEIGKSITYAGSLGGLGCAALSLTAALTWLGYKNRKRIKHCLCGGQTLLHEQSGSRVVYAYDGESCLIDC